jgi:hypothetical protein
VLSRRDRHPSRRVCCLDRFDLARFVDIYSKFYN